MHLGVSEEMRQIETILRQTAGTEDPLLIMGERGVGKEVAAKFVHQISPRADEPFVGVGCAFLAAHCPAIHKDLIDSQLFGHERGAFTNARARHHGYVERAHNGILLLDEVGELPLLMQVKLLRMIQERIFTRVGGETPIKTSARVICSTSNEPAAALGFGPFRCEIHHRISASGVAVVIPPLRERPEDILPYARRFVEEFSEAFGRDVYGFTPISERALLGHRWPGNTRELKDRVERAVATSLGDQIALHRLFPSVEDDDQTFG